MEDNKRKLYDALSQDYDMGTFEQFSSDIQDSSKRRKLYDTIKDEYDLPDFDGFSSQLMGSAAPEEQTVAPAAAKPAQDTSFAKAEVNRSNAKKDGSSMVQGPAAQFMNFDPVGGKKGVSDFKRKMDANVRALDAQHESNMTKLDNMRKASAFGSGKESTFNTDTGKIEEKYRTATGELVDTPMEKAAIDRSVSSEAEVSGDMNAAYEELERINGEIQRRSKEIDEANPTSFATGLASTAPGYDYSMSARINDPELQMLWTAKRSAEDRVKTLEREKFNEGLFKTIGKVIFSQDYMDFGMFDLIDARNMSQYGEAKLQDKALNEAKNTMLESEYESNVAQAKYGENDTFWQRAGYITAQSLPFVAEFFVTGGFSSISSAGTKLGSKVAAKVAAKNKAGDIARWMIKNTGTLAGDIIATTAMANTSGAGKMAADMINNYQGQVIKDEEGNLVFDGGKSWGRSVYEAEVSNILEYFTERLGAHLEGIVPGIAKFVDKRMGASYLSDFYSRISNSSWNKALARGGVNEYPGEVIEEEANILLSHLLIDKTDKDNDTTWKEAFQGKDGKTQIDILGGMFLSIGFMKAPSIAGAVVGGGANKIYNTAQYYTYKHNLDKSDAKAANLMGSDVWGQMRERIDNATNDNIAGVMNDIISDKNIGNANKVAAIKYYVDLMKLRGFNLRTSAQAKDEVAKIGSKDEQPIVANEHEQEVVEAYNRGENANTEDEQRDIFMAYAMAPKDSKEAEVAKAAYDGMVDNIYSKIDTELEVKKSELAEMTHEDGNVYVINMKETDANGEPKQVYLTKGNVVMFADGSGIDHTKSDNIVFYYDPILKKKLSVDPRSDRGIASIVSVTPAEQKIAEYEQEAEQQRADAEKAFKGIVDVKQGQQTVINGQPAVVEAVNGDDVQVRLADGSITNVSLSEMQRLADEAAYSDYIARHGMNGAEAVAETDEEPVAEAQEPMTEEQPSEAPVAEEGAADNALPMDENGNPMWINIAPESAIDYLHNTAELSDEEVADFIKANSKEAEKVLSEVMKNKPKMGTDLAKYKADKDSWQAEVDAAQAGVDYWNGVMAAEEARIAEAKAAVEAMEEQAAKIKAESEARIEAERKAEQERIGKEEKAGYSLSNEIDENGRQFVLNSNGDVEFGRIGDETGLSPAPILLSEGLITDPKTNAGYGLMHIEARHGEQIRKAGYDSVVDFVGQVASNYETIKEGKDRNGNKTYLLQLTDKHNNTLVVELSNDGSYWNINTAGIFNNKYASGNNIVYNRHTQINQQAETGEGSLNAEQSGTQTKTSTMPSTSGGKSTNISSNNEKNVEEKSEVAESNAVKNANKLASDYKNTADKADESRKGHRQIEKAKKMLEEAGSEAKIEAEKKADNVDDVNAEDENPAADATSAGASVIEDTKASNEVEKSPAAPIEEDGGPVNYSVSSSTYTTKRGKDLQMNLVKFDRELTPSEQSAAKEIAKADKGWWSKEHGGFLMRSAEAADSLGKTIAKGGEAVADAQPVSLADVKNVSDEKYKRIKDYIDNHDALFYIQYTESGRKQYSCMLDGRSKTTIINKDEYDWALNNGGKSISAAEQKDIEDSREYYRLLDWFVKNYPHREAEEVAKTIKDSNNNFAKKNNLPMVKRLIELSVGDRERNRRLSTDGEAYNEEKEDAPKADSGMKEVDVMGLMGALKKNGEAKLSDHATDIDHSALFSVGDEYTNGNGLTAKVSLVKTSSSGTIVKIDVVNHTGDNERDDHFSKLNSDKEILKWLNGNNMSLVDSVSQNAEPKRLVSDERMDELKERLRKKLRGQLNVGVDPELLAIGAELAVGHIERGLTKFADYAKQMIDDIGDVIRPYLKSFYNAVRDMPEAQEYAGKMDPYDAVASFDVQNFDKAGAKDIIASAQQVVDEQKVEEDVASVEKEIKDKRNNERKSAENEENFVSLQSKERTPEMGTFVNRVAARLYNSLYGEEKPFNSIVDLRKLAEECGMEVSAEGRDDILLQELVEDAIVKSARRVLGEPLPEGKNKRYYFERIGRLEFMQPTISARSSNRIAMQQYSTPVSMAYVADMFVKNGNPDARLGKVLEPTAGNGMLLIGINPEDVHANELDKTRLANLNGQGFANVTDQDATLPFEGGKQYDAIIANPPFGSAEPKEHDGKVISSIDQQIAINALESMKDNGRASIIIGGNMEYAKNGSVKDHKAFWIYLYDHYNVKGVIDMDGSMYAKQGTKFPTRMILIDGRRSEAERAQSTVYPPVEKAAIKKAMNAVDLYNTLTYILNDNTKTNGTEILRSGAGQPVSNNQQSAGQRERKPSDQQSSKNDGTAVRAERSGDTKQPRTEKKGSEPVLGEPRQDARISARGNAVDTDRAEVRGNERGVAERGAGDNANRPVAAERVSSTRNGLEAQAPRVVEERTLTTDKLPYRQHNTAFSLQSVAPASMVEAMDATLTSIEDRYGNIDDFVTNELGYDSVDEMHNALAAEQVDSVAMAIAQMKDGQGFIIGDQTGVGKGRQMAALIRYAHQQGKKPVFFTQKADLFTDIYRDLADVGSADLKPFIVNSDGAMLESNGKVVYKPLSAKGQRKVFASGEIPADCDYVVVTYSQVNTGDKISKEEYVNAAKETGARVSKKDKEGPSRPSPKAAWIRNIVKDNYLFMDESHTGAGQSNTGYYMQSISKGAKAVTYASATFSKRPDTMPLYALRTAMSEANIPANELIEIIENGGVTLQEIMSRALTDAGQMVRRERDMSGVKTDWKTITDENTVRRSKENYDKTIKAFNAIIDFQKNYIDPLIEHMSKEMAIVASSAKNKKGTKKMGIENVPFASKTYNYTKQLMLSLKTQAIIDEVDAEIKAGRHPVIALESTMESAYKDFVGAELAEPTFAASLLKGLEAVMQYTVKGADGREQHHKYAPSDLGPEGEAEYYKLQNFIREATGDIFISPLDEVIEGLRSKGYKVGELTGRNSYVERTNDGKVVVKKRTDKDKKKMQREFNNGSLDVLILNKSASTGISLHASSKFEDQRQRSMIIAQPLSDINDYMQMIGRIDRTGQVHRGYYINLGLPVPAENRFLMMLSTKLKSLNANTTSAQDSKSNEVDAPDLLNKYGSQVIIEYLRDHTDVYEKMGKPLKVDSGELEKYNALEDDARRVTGYVALLPTNEQEEFYTDVVQRYTDLIKYLNETGNNDLKITVMPLRAELIEKNVSSEGVDPNGRNPFAQNAYVEKVSMDVIRKPMNAEEIKKAIENINGGLNATERSNKLAKAVEDNKNRLIEEENERNTRINERNEKEIVEYANKVNAQDKLDDDQKREAIHNKRIALQEKSAERHASIIGGINNNARSMNRRLNMFKVGVTYLIPDNIESSSYTSVSPAIFCGFKAKESKITPSTTIAVFAVLDGRRRVEVKLNNTLAVDNIYNVTMQNYSSAIKTTIDNWDSLVPNGVRKEGYIMTGNILQAVSDTKREDGSFPGQLISYTDMDGNVHDGILMPDNWKPTSLRTSGKPIITALDYIKKMSGMKGQSIVSSDGKVKLIKAGYWSNDYILEVPKSKSAGSVFFANKDLLDLVRDNNFYQRSGMFRAEVPEQNIEEVVQVLSNLGVRVNNPNSEVSNKFILSAYGNEEKVVNEENTSNNGKDYKKDRVEDVQRGGIIKDEAARRALTEERVRLLETIGRDLGVTFRVGKLHHGGASYNSKRREIVIDERSIDKKGDFTMVFETIVGHELTHHVKEYSKNNKQLWNSFVKILRTHKNFYEIFNKYSRIYHDAYDRGEISEYPTTSYIEEETCGTIFGAFIFGEDVKCAVDFVDNVYHSGDNVVKKYIHEILKKAKEILDRIANSIINHTGSVNADEVLKSAYDVWNAMAAQVIANDMAYYGEADISSAKKLLPLFNTIFESNAAVAVASIKQEKATPEQWLAMLQKNGGLTSGTAVVATKMGGKFKKDIDEEAGRRFLNDPTKPYDEHRAEVIEEKFGNNDEASYRDGVDFEGETYEERVKAARRAGFTKASYDAYIQRCWNNMVRGAHEAVEKIGLGDIIEILETPEGLTGKKAKAKGWFDPKTGKITIVLFNNSSTDDVVRTIFHECVAHYGMRKLFGDNFDNFLDNVYNNVEANIREEIDDIRSKKNVSQRVATEEYIAKLAEDIDYEGHREIWHRIKMWFLNMLSKLGLKDIITPEVLTDNELKYLLWRSYVNIKEPGRYQNNFGGDNVDRKMQEKYKVGEYAESTFNKPSVVAAEDETLFRDGGPEEDLVTGKVLARDNYDKMLSSTKYQFTEAWQDSMLGLKKLYQSILGNNVRIEDVSDYENAYMAENRMSSMNNAQMNIYNEDFIRPLAREVRNLTGGSKAAYQELTDYMMAKHGLERNEVMARRDASRMAEEKYGEELAEARKAAENDPLDEEARLALESIATEMRNFQQSKYDELRDKDYAGLTALTDTEDVQEAEAKAAEMVDAYEAAHDTAKLWELVNKATAKSLSKLYESGMMNLERYNQIRNMFEYYIPLQGFDEKVAEDAYAYIGSDGTLGYGTPIRKAKGRSSKADDPLATIAMNAEATIRQSNRNLMKQRFLNFVQAHPSDLVSVQDVWLKKNDVNGEWEQVKFEDILKDNENLNDTDSPKEIESKVVEFEKRMEELRKQHPEKYKKSRELPNVPYRVVEAKNMNQHQVVVKRNGVPFMLIVNGNPRAAQALNGLTNPDTASGLFEWIEKNLMKAVRWLSLVRTSMSPEFIESNFLRDAIYSNSMAWVKEGPNYSMKFHENFGKVNPVFLSKMYREWQNGELREKVRRLQYGSRELGKVDQMRVYFDEFMSNGGETGCTQYLDLEANKKKLAKTIKEEGNIALKKIKALEGSLQLIGNSVENTARFAAYVTSRDMGRSIGRSIWDAKEISVNFNKKGAGAKFYNSKNQTGLGSILSVMSGVGRLSYMFFNAAVQSLAQMLKVGSAHPAKFSALIGTLISMGVIAPLLSKLIGGDDDDEYYNLPEYVRRTNICFRFSKDMDFITIPMSQEYRCFYGLGELTTSAILGKEKYSDKAIATKYAEQFSQLLPLDFLEGKGGLYALAPDVLKQEFDISANVGWDGRPIHRDNMYTPNAPEWTTAFKSTNEQAVALTKWMNEITGGDDYTKGAVDINPANLEYRLEYIFGGLASFPNKMIKTVETAMGKREYDPRSIVFLSRVMKPASGNAETGKINNMYFNLLDEYEKTKYSYDNYKKRVEKGEDVIEYAERIDFLENSKEFGHYLVIGRYKPIIDKYNELAKDADEQTAKAYKDAAKELRQECVEMIFALDEGNVGDVNGALVQMLDGIITDENVPEEIADRAEKEQDKFYNWIEERSK